MCDGYSPSLRDDHPSLEDELLCEYVDGTMDPVVRDVFEEYLRANPDIKEHAECLRDTRLLLCHYGCQCNAPRDLHDRLRRRITCDLMEGKVPFHVLLTDRFKGATMSSALALLLVVGLAGGVSVLQESEVGGSAVVSAAVIADGSDEVQEKRPRTAPPKFAPAVTPRMSSLGSLPISRRSNTLAVSNAMPVVERPIFESGSSLALLLEPSHRLP